VPESCIIAVAITGSLPRKEDNPAVPISTSEQIESTHQAFEAGASLVHIHVRNDDQTSSSDPERFAAVQEGVRLHCPGMIVQFSTGGRGRDASARGSSLYLEPDMASLSTGSVNFPLIVYENHPALVDELASKIKANGILPEIEIFDLSHLHAARRLADLDLIGERPHIQFVMGVQNAMPAEERLLDIMLSEAKTLFPHCTWTAAGIGRNQSLVMNWALARGADAVRTGLEDNIRIARERLASSNAQLVEHAVAAVQEQGRRVASTAEARSRLGLAPR
jgi:3-keto-5-aminohexanoate cleavage enzyme